MHKILSIILIVTLTPLAIGQENYPELWEQVYRYELENQLKSALVKVDGIYAKAKKENNDSQLIKALVYQSKFSLTLQEDAQFSVVKQFEQEIATSVTPAKNILQSMLANLYWEYFKANRWKLYNRTQSSVKIDKTDFRTWDLTTLFSEISHYYKASTTNEFVLQQSKLEDFYEILQLHKNSKNLQPTLYDFLLQNSLEFFKDSESSILKPSYKFTLSNSALLANATSFMEIPLVTKDTLSQSFNALVVYQKLLKHQYQNRYQDAFVNTDIERIRFIEKHATFPNKEQQFLETLHTSSKEFKAYPGVGYYTLEIARRKNQQAQTYRRGSKEIYRYKNNEAIELCDEITVKFPRSTVAKKALALKENIQASTLDITSEKHIPVGMYSKILVNYKNIKNLRFSIYKMGTSAMKALQKKYKKEAQITGITKQPKITSWSCSLPDTKDFQKHSTEVGIPKLEQGYYIILAESTPDDSKKAITAFSAIQVTDIALIGNVSNTNSYQVVNRTSGKPLAKASVIFRSDPKNKNNKSLYKSFTTDKNGEFSFKGTMQYYYDITAKIQHKRDTATFSQLYINPRRNTASTLAETRNNRRTFLFTDRSIYRPGQIVYCKGILLQNSKDKGAVLANKNVIVRLKDSNYQTVQELSVTTNTYGSFSTEFLLPNTGLTGSYTIEASVEDQKNYTKILVEEYKIQKFKVAFTPSATTFKVKDTITRKGTAISYANTPISDAKVAYRIYRNVEYPRWWYWSHPNFYSTPEEISFGTTQTDATGNFEIAFIAQPDESISPENLPIFNYTISADVTDINGETRSIKEHLKIGYHSLQASITIDEILDKNTDTHQIAIATKNINGTPIFNKGTVSVFKLKAPGRPLRNRPWAFPDYPIINQKEYLTKFPYEAYKKESNVQEWEKEKLVFTSSYDTEEDTKVPLNSISKWSSGKYMVVLHTKDSTGKSIKDVKIITVMSLKDKIPSDASIVTITTDKENYKPGEQAILKVSSGAKSMYVMVEITRQYGSVSKHYLHLHRNQKQINIPISAKDMGGIHVNWYYVAYNSFTKGSRTISVPFPKKDLEITTNTFRDKLVPGSQETWRFTIKGAQKEPVSAEVLASMYDASLDALQPHQWRFSPLSKPQFRRYNQAYANMSFGNTVFTVYMPKIPRTFFNDYPNNAQYKNFGFSFTNNRWLNQQYLRNLAYQKKKFDGTISGIVSDESSYLPGVSIRIKGTNFGTETNFDGAYSIRVNKGDTLVFSYVGMQSVEKVVTNFSDIDLLMESDGSIENVIATGYGYASGDASRKFQGGINGIEISAETSPESTEEDKDNTIENSEEKNTFKEMDFRKNLKETAFFFPQLKTDNNGNVSFEFTTPEALTTWKLQVLAHTKNLHSGIKTKETVTQKQVMVTPSLPRFLRKGDSIVIRAKITNTTTKILEGTANISFQNPLTGENCTWIPDSTSKKEYSIDAAGNTQVSWKLKVPDTLDLVQIKIAAQAGNFSDGEQTTIPILSNRILVTEALPFWTSGEKSKTFTLEKLKNNTSKTRLNHKLTLEITSNPVWYAVQALPYLLESNAAGSEQIFSRYYANSIAQYITTSNPKIEEVFTQWAAADLLISNLEKNQELKSILLEETPWIREAQSEEEQRKRIALLFEIHKIKDEKQRIVSKLRQMQLPNGGFPWFKGNPQANRSVTQHIVTGFGHLQQLGISELDVLSTEIIEKALVYLDTEIAYHYQNIQDKALRIKKTEVIEKSIEFLQQNHLSDFNIRYLYLRQFFKQKAIPENSVEAVKYFQQQTEKYWMDVNLQQKALIALQLFRNNRKDKARIIIQSLKETSILSEEKGMYWKANKAGWMWSEAPIETQALLIETFSEIEPTPKIIEKLKLWLLKNKQVNRWKTTKATAAAIHALVHYGSNLHDIKNTPTVSVGAHKIIPEKSEDTKIMAGTGYFKTSWTANEISSDMSTVEIKPISKTALWGGLYWQYFENLNTVSATKSSLKIEKKLFKKVTTENGLKLVPISEAGAVKIGDIVTTKIVLYSDRDMQYLHIKDNRASGLEPLDNISKYKWQDGISFYQSIRDTATNFFFDYLPKGIYVFECDTRASHTGIFSTGIAMIENFYAPELRSNSKGSTITIKN